MFHKKTEARYNLYVYKDISGYRKTWKGTRTQIVIKLQDYSWSQV